MQADMFLTCGTRGSSEPIVWELLLDTGGVDTQNSKHEGTPKICISDKFVLEYPFHGLDPNWNGTCGIFYTHSGIENEQQAKPALAAKGVGL